MQISVSTGSNTIFSPIDVNGIEDVAQAALKYSVSAGVYADNYRNLDNFKRAEFIGLDIDEGMTLEEAKSKFSKYIHAILPTRNHQANKNGKICDRFRVFLQLSEPIDNEKDFYETWHQLQSEFGAIDPAAKDPSRQFYSCKKIEHLGTTGRKVQVKKWTPPATSELAPIIGVKGELGKATFKFLALGAQPGARNNDLYKALRDMYQNNYTKEEALSLVNDITIKIGLSSEEVELTADSAFSRDPKHEARIEDTPFRPVTVDEMYKQKEVKLDWILKDLLPRGAISIIAGPPKAGKSTLIRQLCANIAMGQDRFLNRKVTPGKVLYLALEEQAEVLKDEYKRLGITGNNFYVFVGAVDKEKVMASMKEFIIKNKIDFVVIDTLMVFSAIENSNDYKETYNAMSDIREMARETGCHIMCVHHTNKSQYQGANSIMGSSAFLGGVDVAIIFKSLGERRYIQSQQRPGRPFTGEELLFHKDTNTYTLGKKKEKDETPF